MAELIEGFRGGGSQQRGGYGRFLIQLAKSIQINSGGAVDFGSVNADMDGSVV